ncbi:MAG: hypothetical protein PHF46_01160 [Candidatus Gracilibacteria bacterium]|nr:hypothetical protein [Candidatus Gracilibacteria bacterium]MDD3119999.1 hypothetical protein [Candidatus Gracilibacteria bacterium]MDD4529977.1 hypothetical protein [Candidatus Gracilibacteria bacterium]
MWLDKKSDFQQYINQSEIGDKNIGVKTNCFIVGSKEQFKSIHTLLGSCVGFCGYHKQTGIGFVVHIFSKINEKENVEILGKIIKELEQVLKNDFELNFNDLELFIGYRDKLLMYQVYGGENIKKSQKLIIETIKQITKQNNIKEIILGDRSIKLCLNLINGKVSAVLKSNSY